MDLKDIQDLIKFVAKSGATEVDLEIDNIKISIKSPAKKRRGEKQEPENIIVQPVMPHQISDPVAIPSIPTTTQDAPEITKKEAQKEEAQEENENHTVIKSSMIGTFYRSASPDEPPFVSVGDIIKPGDTICIIEAMKLFNEIESEVSAKIVKVMVDDATPVEFDQPLFLVEIS